ncbi:MAG: homoserine O-acetyltransferase [Planctomycetaceae bacterium]|nr:homoserine O-acetyltransferase [Planctomycetaceae bacterium]
MTTETTTSSDSEQGSVGIVERKTVRLFDAPNQLDMKCGTKFGPIDVAYETYGELSEQRDNAIFVCHALTGDAHVAGYHSPDDQKPGWWDEFVGPGKALDTRKYFVICANALGGCQGTTGPTSIDPDCGQPFALNLPVISISDIIDVHAELVRYLGIEKLLAIIGGSLGGMQVLDWAVRYPEQMDGVICLASGPRLSAQGIAFNAVGRRAIVVDPQYHAGDYYGKEEGPRYGLALARMVAHITYLSEASIEKKFGRRLQDSDEFAYKLEKETEFQIESYLHYQGKRFVERFDANSYMYLTKAMDYFDLAEGYESLADALSQSQASFLIASYTTDWLFPTIQSREIVTALIGSGKRVTFAEFDSPFGHDSFLLEFEQLEELVSPFLTQAFAARRGKSS